METLLTWLQSDALIAVFATFVYFLVIGFAGLVIFLVMGFLEWLFRLLFVDH